MRLDNWVVTGDQKLIHYMDLCHNLQIPDMGAGMLTVITPQESKDGYFQQALALISHTSAERRKNGVALPKPSDMETILQNTWDHVEHLLKQ